jgi:hypothetical protein
MSDETSEINVHIPAETVQNILDDFFPSNTYEDEKYQYVRAYKLGLPEGTRLVECYETPAGFVIVGTPPEETDETNPKHSCEANRCGQSHVLYRFNKEDSTV